MQPIYLDYNATTPLLPEVITAMKPYLESFYGNPSSAHRYGIQTKAAITRARGQIAGLIGCRPEEILFTSGGTESNNLAIKGISSARRNQGNHIITSSVEHPAVTEVCRYLEQNGFTATYLPVDGFGMVDPDDLEKAITSRTILISVMHANNEVGTIQPIAELSKIAKAFGIPFHTDAAQSIGKIPVTVDNLGIDLLTIAGHKLYAPKGIGALYIRTGVQIDKLIHGASHEFNLRAGTENVLEITGLGAAAEWMTRHLPDAAGNMRKTRDQLEDLLRKAIPEILINGHPERRLPNTLSVSFPGTDANTLLDALQDKIAASAGAACHSDSVVASSVLRAMGVPDEAALGTIRFSTGQPSAADDVRIAADSVIQAYRKIKGASEPTVQFEAETARLTQFTRGLGCACKLRPQDLESILKKLPRPADPNLLVGTDTSDDAAVYKINDDTAIVQTVDFFTPIVDDPYTFGAIAAVNALSDVYAMGAKPMWALNLAAFPAKRLPMSILEKILQGAQSVAEKAGISIAGGHTIEDSEPKYGLCVTGVVHPDKILRNHTARPGDSLFLTKPLGTGIITTGIKRKIVDEDLYKEVIASMLRLNDDILAIAENFLVTACTDVTGFGLLGHLIEMCGKGRLGAEINLSEVPVFSGVRELVLADVIPGGTLNNLEYANHHIKWAERVTRTEKIILSDAQTSGGLLFSAPKRDKDGVVRFCKEKGIFISWIGMITDGQKISVQ